MSKMQIAGAVAAYLLYKNRKPIKAVGDYGSAVVKAVFSGAGDRISDKVSGDLESAIFGAKTSDLRKDSNNPAYPNGVCFACGMGVDAALRCYNPECSKFNMQTPARPYPEYPPFTPAKPRPTRTPKKKETK